MEMYKKGYDKHTNQIFIEKTGAGGKIVVALAEGNFIRKIQQHIKTDLKNFHLCGWIFQLIALVSFDKGIILPFGRMICSQDNTCIIFIITL